PHEALPRRMPAPAQAGSIERADTGAFSQLSLSLRRIRALSLPELIGPGFDIASHPPFSVPFRALMCCDSTHNLIAAELCVPAARELRDRVLREGKRVSSPPLRCAPGG